MKKILGLSFIVITTSPLVALADLGEADLENNESFVSSEVHNAYCKVSGNKCTITFVDGKMKVDNSSGIHSSQIISINREPVPTNKPCFLCSEKEKFRQGSDEFLITYTREDGSKARAKFLFTPGNGGGDKLKRDIEHWLGQKLRKIGPSIKLEL